MCVCVCVCVCVSVCELDELGKPKYRSCGSQNKSEFRKLTRESKEVVEQIVEATGSSGRKRNPHNYEQFVSNMGEKKKCVRGTAGSVVVPITRFQDDHQVSG